MKNFKKFKLLLLCPILIGLSIISCEKDDYYINEQNNVSSEINDKSLQSKNENFKGAKKLQNPYSVKNMNKALANIKKSLKEKKIKTKGTNPSRLEETINDLEFNTTYYYVKFTPQNSEEESLIKNDVDLHVFDYPLDYEFTDEYLDNRTPDNDSIPEYYTAVPIGKELPTGVASEIIENLYIPEEDPFFDTYEISSEPETMTRQGEIGNNEDLLRHLLMEAFTLTGNEKELMPEGDTTNSWWIFGSKWYPSGKLKIWDDNAGSSTITSQTFSHWEYYNCDTGEIVPAPEELLPYVKVENVRIAPIDENICQRAIYTYSTSTTQGKYVPLEGAQVLMRQWFTIRQGITDSNGNFSTGSVRGKARYIIQWERYHYSIRSGWFGQAEKRGPKVNDEFWNYNIKGGAQEFYGTIHRATHHYYYKNIKGLKRPPTNSFWKPQMKIAAHNRDNDDKNGYHQKDLRIFGIVPRLNIYNPNRETAEIYSTTIHELAHASHWELRKDNWNDNNLSDKVKESWARGVEWELTRMIYPPSEYKGRERSTGDYTLIVADLIDGNFDNADEATNYGYNDIRDEVSGYTIKQIEDVLSFTWSWNSWRDNIRNSYTNTTSNHLDKLFLAYE